MRLVTRNNRIALRSNRVFTDVAGVECCCGGGGFPGCPSSCTTCPAVLNLAWPAFTWGPAATYTYDLPAGAIAMSKTGCTWSGSPHTPISGIIQHSPGFPDVVGNGFLESAQALCLGASSEWFTEFLISINMSPFHPDAHCCGVRPATTQSCPNGIYVPSACAVGPNTGCPQITVYP